MCVDLGCVQLKSHVTQAINYGGRWVCESCLACGGVCGDLGFVQMGVEPEMSHVTQGIN